MSCSDETCYFVIIGRSIIAAILLLAVVICCIVWCAKRRKRLNTANKRHDQGSRGGVTITEYDLSEEDKTSLNATENESDPVYDNPVTIVRERASTGDLYTVPQKKTVIQGNENNGPETKNPKIIEKDSRQSLGRDTNTPSTEKQINEDDKLNEPIYQDPTTIQRERAPTGDIYTLPQRKPSSKAKMPSEAKPGIVTKKDTIKASLKEPEDVCRMIESSVTADDTVPPPIPLYNGPPLDNKEQTDSASDMLCKKKPVTLVLTTIGDSEYAEIQ